LRLFIALDLPDSARADLALLQERMPVGRLVPEENLHLTLAFLGETGEAEAEAVHDALETLRAPPVPLMLAGPEIFGGRHGQAVAIGADGGPALADLHNRVAARVRGAGLTPERRRFRPHVTLARMKGKADAGPSIAALQGQRLGAFDCDSVGLYASTLHRDGSIHEALAVYPLAPRP
jgi:2'-5' RNA ligase